MSAGNYKDRRKPRESGKGERDLHDNDLELLRRARMGEEGAFHELVDRYSGTLFRLAFLLVGNEADAEDVVQETLLGAFRGLGRFRGESSVKTWLTAILVKRAQAHRRARSRGRTSPLKEAGESQGRMPNSPVQQADARMDVQAVLAALSAEHRQVLVLREYEGMSYDEIARALDMPRGTVESRLFRAREHLRRLLKGYG